MAVYSDYSEREKREGIKYGTKKTFTTSSGTTISGTHIGGGAFVKQFGSFLSGGFAIFKPTPYEPIDFDKSYQNAQTPDNPGVREVVFSGYGEHIPVSIGKRLLSSNVIDATPLEPRLIGYREWYELVKEPSTSNVWGCSGEGWSIEGTYAKAWGSTWNFNVVKVTGDPPAGFCWFAGYSSIVIAETDYEAVDKILNTCGCGVGVG